MNLKRQLLLDWSTDQSNLLTIRGITGKVINLIRFPIYSELNSSFSLLLTEFIEPFLHGDDSVQPISGSFQIEGDSINFISRFNFMSGVNYSFVIKEDVENKQFETEFWSIERPLMRSAPSTSILGVYPSGSEIPLNLLKIYVYFSSKMSEGFAARNVQFCDTSTSQVIPDVFLPMDPELWDESRTRLTLLLDPGRIKRGLVPNMETGYPLNEGVSVAVTVDKAFQDSAGRNLVDGIQKEFNVGKALRLKVNHILWKYTIPSIDSFEPFSINFDRPLDRGLLENSLKIVDSQGQHVQGESFVDIGEHSWRLIPKYKWITSDYQLIINPLLEDLAGNSLIRVFDRDVENSNDDPIENNEFSYTFKCVENSS